MSYVSLFRDALRSVIGTTWPDVLPVNGGGGSFDEEHAERVRWADLKPPYAVAVLPSMTPAAPPTRMAALTDVAVVDIYRVQFATGPSDNVWEQLVALQAALWPNSLPAGSGVVQQIDGKSTDGSLTPNRMFLSKNMSARAGLIRVRCLLAYYRPGV